MRTLVVVKDKDIYTTTLIIADQLEYDHEMIMKLIKNHIDIENFSTLKVEKIRTKGRPQNLYYLDEEQTMLLISLMKNSKKVVDLKIKMVKAFFKQRRLLRDILVRQRTAEEVLAREESKTMRLEATDTIKEFINYAYDQGSKSAHMYYANISKMQNKSLFLLSQEFKGFNIRELLDFKQLALVKTADIAVMESLKEGMSINKPYKEIYIDAKKKIEALAKIFPPSPLPTLLLRNTENE